VKELGAQRLCAIAPQTSGVPPATYNPTIATTNKTAFDMLSRPRWHEYAAKARLAGSSCRDRIAERGSTV